MLKLSVKLAFLALIFILSSCSPASKSAKLLANIENRFKKERGIEHGSLIAIYDLAGRGNPGCLHAKDYGLIINDEGANLSFIKKVMSQGKKEALERRAKTKIAILKSRLATLHDKYMILNSSDARKLDLKEDDDEDEDSIFSNINDNLKGQSSNHLKELHNIDQIARHVPIFFPLQAAKLTSHFGMRKHPIKGCKKFHYGTDFAGTKASLVYSAAYGKVISIERVSGYGNTVVIDHNKQFQTRYAHLSKILVENGENVIRGQKVGLQGKTGTATSEHLHFEVLFKGKHINPIDFVASARNCTIH